MRYYLNNFTDGAKQDAIDYATGNYTVQKGTPSGPYSRKPASKSWVVSWFKPAAHSPGGQQACTHFDAGKPSPFTDYKSPTLPLLAATVSVAWALCMAVLLLAVRLWFFLS